MYLHGNHTSNVLTTTIMHPFKQLTRTAFKQPWILSSQTNTRIMAACVETYLICIVSGRFGVGCVERERTYHLMDALKMYYENITTDWEGKLYCGIKMKWDDKNSI